MCCKNNSDSNRNWLIWVIAALVTMTAVTIGVITYIKVKAHKLNKALYEASEFIAFDDDDVDDMINDFEEDELDFEQPNYDQANSKEF